MITKVTKIDRERLTKDDLTEACELLRAGELVAFPTETVYGLGGNAFDETAAKRIYEAKGRPSDNPLIVHISRSEDLRKLAVHIPETAWRLAEAFWPGPLTMILQKSDSVPKSTTGGLDTVAIRLPSDPIARLMIQESGVFVAAPSANASGRPSTTTSEHVYEDLNGKIPLILDGGPVKIGLESTIVDLTGEKPVILRPGYITGTMIADVIGEVSYDQAVIAPVTSETLVAKAPGMKYRHYAPKGELTIIEGNREAVIAAINTDVKKRTTEGYTVGILATDETAGQYRLGTVFSIGSRADEDSICAHLFQVLREFDEIGAQYIYSESFDELPHGKAIMNRLRKAAGYRIISVS